MDQDIVFWYRAPTTEDTADFSTFPGMVDMKPLYEKKISQISQRHGMGSVLGAKTIEDVGNRSIYLWTTYRNEIHHR